MATDISKVNNVVRLTRTGHVPRDYANVAAEYYFYSAGGADFLHLEIGKDQQESIPLSDLTIGGETPSDVDDAYDKMSAVFPDANSGNGGSGGLPYSALTVSINQVDDPDPTIVMSEEFQNDFGITDGDWSRISAGIYRCTKTGVFLDGKTFFTAFGSQSSVVLPISYGVGLLGYYTLQINDENSFSVAIYDTNFQPADIADLGAQFLPIDLRVYDGIPR